MTGKRARSPSAETFSKPPKRQARELVVTDGADEQEESLEQILMLIKQQEESEALAKRLQSQYNESGSSSHAGSSSEVIVLDDDEDDEAMARRLAREWAEQDAAASAEPVITSSFEPTASTSTTLHDIENEPVTTPDRILKEHASLFTASRPCTKCGHDVASPRGYVTYSSQIPPPSLTALLHATCSSCQTNHCRGCFSVIPCPPSCRGKDKECRVLSCCANVRAIALFEALGGFDRQYLGERATSDSRSKEAAAAYRAKKTESVGPGGTGYGTSTQYSPSYGFGHGSGRGRGRGRGGAQPSTEDVHTCVGITLAKHMDEIIVRAFSTITMILPAPYAESPQEYDMLPHPSTTALLQLSQLPELLASLLRNDSVTDWISRSDVYNAMLALLRRMADCELTLEVIIGCRYEMEKTGGLEEYLWGDAPITWSMSDGNPVKSNPLYVYFQKLTKQCETFLAGASHMLEGAQAVANPQQNQDGGEDMETVIRGTSLCGEIIATRDDLERTMRLLGRVPPSLTDPPADASVQKGKNKSKGKGPDPTREIERLYRQVCEQLAFKHIPFPRRGASYATYNYDGQLQRTSTSTRNPKDRLHLIKELAVMATSLPTGVWVRVDEVRNDALKIMIAGPEGTPYEGGLFEFDCFLPLDYPHSPPQMHLRTTGFGSVRFNPNLYNCGKVCLSLLGTWPGQPEEQWSSKSTLLQVLVSIQSMILVELPWFNEPGMGKAQALDARSIEYNKNITVNTVRWVMVEWLKDEHKDSIWADVITSHFTIRAAKIRQCIERWAKSEPRIRNFSPQTPGQSGNYGHSIFAMYGEPSPFGEYSDENLGIPQKHTPRGMDLLTAFDQGMQTIRKWEQTWKA